MATTTSPPLNLPPKPKPSNSAAAHHRRRPHHSLPLLELCRRPTEFAQLHATLSKLGLILNPLHSARLAASAAASPSALSYARRLFDLDPNPNSFAFNALIRGLAQSPRPDLALSLFLRMLASPSNPNAMTFPFVLKACAALAAFQFGRQVHGLVLKFGLAADSYVMNSLINFYARNLSFGDALLVFDRMPQRDVVAWNSVVAGLASVGLMSDAQEVFDRMPERNVVSWNCLIDGYVKGGFLEIARGLFDGGLMKNSITWNVMIGGYTGSNRMAEAGRLFGRMPMELKDLTTFNVMIDGYVKESRHEEVLGLFDQMLDLELRPNSFTLVSVLSACSRLLDLERGEWIHGYVGRHGMRLDAVLGTALLDMYAKCGKMERALFVFNCIEEKDKDIGAWNSMISNLGIHGNGKEALQLFYEVLETDTKPDEITFLSVLSACCHSGLVEEGRTCFNLMRQVYDIEPKAEHYGCMVDLLCRSGLLEEARELIVVNAGQEFSVAMWGALLGASSRLGNVEMGEYAAEHLFELDSSDARCYVALANLYSRAGRWEDAVAVREMMRRRGMEKAPGCSVIEVNGVVHEFRVGSGFNVLEEMEKN